MLNTLEFRPAPSGYSPLVLGVLVTECTGPQNVEFSVPAHVMGTLNVVRQGSLWYRHQRLPDSFATGAHDRSRRYVISAGALLLTLFCRAESLQTLSGRTPAELANQWLAPELVFPEWLTQHRPLRVSTPWPDVADALLCCAAPPALPTPQPPELQRRSRQLQHATATLHEHPGISLAELGAMIGLGARDLQRLFRTGWGVTPKLVQRMLRIQRGLQLWQQTSPGLADLAAQLGLSDQAHLAREFRQLVGIAPRALKHGRPKRQDDQQPDPLWALRTGAAHLMPLLLTDPGRSTAMPATQTGESAGKNHSP